MAIVIGVRFKEAGRVYYFDPGEHEFKPGERVIVETARGVECGEVLQANREAPEQQITHPLKPVIRSATADDLHTLESKAEKEKEAFRICEEKIGKHGLAMKLVNVEYTFDASKIIFHFTADQRVDFRALVRDLASVFRTRIELRQIGVRDEAKLLGGLGICGRPFCCNLYMGDFHPVSIKMAKEQNLSLNPVKISGTCGRLMCCLKYEEAAYEDAMKNLPRVGSSIETPDGRGVVTEVNAVSEMIKVRLEKRPEAVPQSFRFSKLEGVTRKPQTVRDDMLPPLLLEEPEAPEPPKSPPPGRAEEQKPQQGGRSKDSWRDRHAPPRQKREGQQPRQARGGSPAQKAAPQAKKPQPAAEDSRNVPRYGEVAAPRRVNAPRPPQESQENKRPGDYHRQPWQKRQGSRGGNSKGGGNQNNGQP
jgi:cell fate regulator YaaT (PSP1 superfamily)